MTNQTACPTCGTELPPDAPAQVCPRCLLGAGLVEPPPDEAQPAAEGPFAPDLLERLFPKLEILEQLGQGGMGVVYKARQKDLDRFVALKLLRPKVADDPAFAERFGREARALARLSHPNIVGVYEFGEQDGLFYFVMEYVDGCTLRDAMSAGGLEPEEALRIVPLICDALQFAHDQGVVHRDIKPENVLIGLSGEVKIADFGLAKLVERGRDDFTLTRRDQVMGTPHYMAPEQIESPQQVDHRADIYSLGVVFYELLTGELPIGRFDPPSERAQTDVRLDGVVLRTLEKERGRRFQHASEVRSTLEALETNGHRAVEPASGVVAQAVLTPLPAEDGVKRPSSGSELCRRAVVGLMLVVGSVPVAALGLLLGSAGTVATISGPLIGGLVLLVVGWITSIAGWVRIHRNPERLHGKGYAIAGSFLPLLVCVGMLVLAPLMAFGARQAPTSAAVMSTPLPIVEVADEGSSPPAMPRALTDGDVAVRGGPAEWDVVDFQREKAAVLERVAAAIAAIGNEVAARKNYSASERAEMRALPADELTRLWRERKLGFPLLVPSQLGGSASRYGPRTVEFDDQDGTSVTVTLGTTAGDRIAAHLRKMDGEWFFIRERVEIEQTR